MNIFLAYGYNPRDQWVREMVKPIVEAFGATPNGILSTQPRNHNQLRLLIN